MPRSPRNGLQLAVPVAVAGLAVTLVVGEDQLDDRSSRASRTRAEFVCTFMPSKAGVTQEAMRVFAPSTSTMQTRQDPIACTFFR